MKKITLFILLWGFHISNAQENYIDFNQYKTQTLVNKTTPTKAILNRARHIVFEEIKPILPDEIFWRTAKDIFCGRLHDRWNIEVDAERSAAFLQQLMEVGVGNFVEQIRGVYSSTDAKGDTVVLSGKLILPKHGKIKNIIVVCHYTIGSNREAPSECLSFESLLALKGYAVVMPDYIGYGITHQYKHPYLHLQSVARSSVDMMLAIHPYLATIGRAPESSFVILVGYSQGGAAVLALQRELEKNYPSIFPIQHVYAGGGPYDLAGTYDFAIREDKIVIPCVIPMLIQGMNEGDALGLNMNDFFVDPILSHYDLWINSKNYTIGAINRMINETRPSKLLTAQARDTTNVTTRRLYGALQHNSLLNFKPQSPLYIFHSQEDTWVPFLNGEHLYKSFQSHGISNVEYDFESYGDHMCAGVEFIMNVFHMLP